MADILVVEKSERQRRIESLLLFVVPPAIAVAFRLLLGAAVEGTSRVRLLRTGPLSWTSFSFAAMFAFASRA